MKKSLASILAIAMILSCMTGLFTFTASAETAAVAETTESAETVVSNFNLTKAMGTGSITRSADSTYSIWTSETNTQWWWNQANSWLYENPYLVIKYRANFAGGTTHYPWYKDGNGSAVGITFVNTGIEETSEWAYAVFDLSGKLDTSKTFNAFRMDLSAGQTLHIAEVRGFADAAAYQQYQAGTEGIAVTADTLATANSGKLGINNSLSADGNYAIWKMNHSDPQVRLDTIRNYLSYAPYMLITYKSDCTDNFNPIIFGSATKDTGGHGFYKTGLDSAEWAYKVIDLSAAVADLTSITGFRLDPTGGTNGETKTVHFKELRFFSSMEALTNSLDSTAYNAEMLVSGKGTTSGSMTSITLSEDGKDAVYTMGASAEVYYNAMRSNIEALPFMVIKYKANFASLDDKNARVLIQTTAGTHPETYFSATVNTGLGAEDEYAYMTADFTKVVENNTLNNWVRFDLTRSNISSGIMHINEIRLYPSKQAYLDSITPVDPEPPVETEPETEVPAEPETEPETDAPEAAPTPEETTEASLAGGDLKWAPFVTTTDTPVTSGVHFSTQGGALHSVHSRVHHVNNSGWSGMYTLTLYKWDTDYATTIQGTPVGVFTPRANASNNQHSYYDTLIDGNPLPAGEYYAEFTTAKDTLAPAQVTSAKDTTGYLVEYYRNGSTTSDAFVFDITVGPRQTTSEIALDGGDGQKAGSASEGGSIGLHINSCDKFFAGIDIFAWTGGKAGTSGELRVWKWDTDVTTSKANAENCVYTQAFTNVANGGYMTATFTSPLAPGEYYCEWVETAATNGFGAWTINAENVLTEEQAKYFLGAYTNGNSVGMPAAKSNLRLADSVSNFYSASVTVGDDYAINFKVAADDIHVAATYEIVLTGENGLSLTYGTAADALVPSTDANGTFIFTFEKIGPHQMGNIIKAELRAYDINGNLIGSDSVEYSIKQYCEKKIATSKDVKFVTMLKDMLNYGAAAQKYVDSAIAESDLVNSGMDTTTSTTVPAYTDTTVAHTPDGNIGFKTVSVRLNNGVEIILKTANTENNVIVGDETLVKENGIYVHRISLLSLTQAYTYTIDGTGATLTYSLPIYIARQQSADANLSALLTELMKFGMSLNEWAA